MSASADPILPSTRGSGLASLNAAAVIIAALYFGRELAVPLVLAVLLAFVLAPLVGLLQRARLGHGPAVLLTVLAAFAIIGGIGLVVARQGAALVDNLPTYGAAIQQKLQSLRLPSDIAEQVQTAIRTLLGGGPSAGGAGASTLVIVRGVGEVLLGPLSTAGVVAVFTIFVLLAREDLRDRLIRLVGRRDLHRTIVAMNDAAHRLSRYFLFQLSLNAGFGLFIGIGLWLAGLPNFVLWGVLAALMRFIPYIGTFIAGAPPLLLALAISPGWSLPLLVLVMFGVTDLLIGQVIEPLLYGHSTGLSPIAVVLSAAFWALLWGPVGLLIATPLTVCLVVVGRYVAPLAFLEVALGDGPPLDPHETFYQRALEGHTHDVAVQARRTIRATSLADYYDRIALPGLVLAQADLARDVLAFDRLEQIHQRIEQLLTGLPQASTRVEEVPAAWRAEGAVLCIPGRGQLDDLGATMAMQVLREAGFGARCESNLVLGASKAPVHDVQSVRLCCLSVLEQGSGVSAVRYLVRRMQRRMPNASIVVGLWHAAGDSAMLAELRSVDERETIVLSLAELAALARAISARWTGLDP